MRSISHFPIPLSKAKGPISLALYSAHRIGWIPVFAPHPPGTFLTREGRQINFSLVSPAEVKVEGLRDAKLSIWEVWGVGKIDPPKEPLTAPLLTAMKKSRPNAAGCIRSVSLRECGPAYACLRLVLSGPHTAPHVAHPNTLFSARMGTTIGRAQPMTIIGHSMTRTTVVTCSP